MKNNLMVLLTLCLCLPGLTFAGEKEDELITKVTEAYGGDLIRELASFRIEDRFIAPATGQSISPDLTEVGSSRQVLVVDIKNNRAVYDSWNEGRQGGFQNSVISDGENAQTINYQSGTYGKAANADPKVFAGGTMRTSDTVLVYELNQVKDKAVLGEDVVYMNRPHHTLSMPFPSSPDLKLFIDAKTFLVSRMQRINPQLGSLDYVYGKHKQHNGVGYASTINFLIAGVPNIISTMHEATFNFEPSADLFALADGLEAEGERIDTSEMLVNKISDRVFHIGQGGGFSLFVDSGVGTIAAGGYPALKARFARFQSESDNYQPLTHQVVTHHHSDHIGGMAEAIELGARLVTVDENVAAIKAGTSPTPEDRHFYRIGSRASFGRGSNRVDIYEVSTIHAASFLVTYVPADKLVFIADHMGSPFAKGLPVANSGTVDMLAALEALDIDIRKIATAHNARIFSMQDMKDSVAAYKPSKCSGDRPICG